MFIKPPDSQDDKAAQQTSLRQNDSEESSSSVSTQQTIVSLMPVNGYDANGKLVISKDKFGHYELKLSLAMPAEFKGTYYEAYLVGSRTISLGKLERKNGLYKLDYVLNEPISQFKMIKIIVDGDAATVEGKTLPHDVIIGEIKT